MSQKERQTRKEKAEETRKKLYASAEKLFRKDGYETVSIDDIAKDAGVAKGSFYVHFESKDALIAMLITEYVVNADHGYKEFLEAFPDHMPFEEVVLSLIGKIAEVISEKVGAENMKLLYRVQLGKELKESPAASYQRELYKLFLSVLEKGVQENRCESCLSLEDTAKHLVIAYRGVVYEWCMRYPDADLQTLARDHYSLLLQGLLHS